MVLECSTKFDTGVLCHQAITSELTHLTTIILKLIMTRVLQFPSFCGCGELDNGSTDVSLT